MATLLLLIFVALAHGQTSFCTGTQYSYSGVCMYDLNCSTALERWSEPNCIREQCFRAPVLIGDAAGYTVTFNNSVLMAFYLPASGEAGIFNQSAINPSETSAGVFGGHLLAALLNVAVAENFTALSTLRYNTTCDVLCPSVHGKTVLEVIHIAQQVIAGLPLDLYTPQCLSDALAYFNNAFDKCQQNGTRACLICESREEQEELPSDDAVVATWLSGSIIFFVVLVAVGVIILVLVIRFSPMRKINTRF